jgi:predicted secreted protein
MKRRAFLEAIALGAAGFPGALAAQPQSDREHRVELEVPILSEEPAAVPIRVSLEHPMDPDHHIRSIEVTIDGDPVPAKGRFMFSPHNGRAWAAYQVRSGTGGVVKAVAVCNRQGELTASRSVRVVEGGCSTPPERANRDRAGSPELRLPRTVRVGEPFEVRVRLLHGSYTGLALKQGRFVRELPEYFVKQMTVWLDDEQVSEFQMTSAVSPNPLVRFPLRVRRAATLRVQFVNSEGQRWDVAEPIRV